MVLLCSQPPTPTPGHRTTPHHTLCPQLSIVESYLPAQMGAEEVAALVGSVVAELGATGPKDMGKVMAALKVGGGFVCFWVVVGRMSC